MRYNVILKVGYYERRFEFADLQEAGKFAEAALTHQVLEEDEKQLYISIDIAPEEEHNEHVD